MGQLDPDQLRPELRDALEGLKAGEYSAVVHIPAGFAVLTIFPARKSAAQLNPERIQELMSSGVVRFGIEVAGDVEENAAFADYPKEEGWNRDLRAVCSIRKDVDAAAVDQLNAMMAQAQAAPAESTARST